jgi:hypothetical protein
MDQKSTFVVGYKYKRIISFTNTRESLALLCPEIMFEAKWQRGT